MFNGRPSQEDIHMQTAFLWAKRSTCKQPNRKIGCIITTINAKRILAIGYNGGPTPMNNNSCRNLKGDCGCLHAEQNAIAMVDGTIRNKVMFVTMEPCESCANLIIQAGIMKVYFCEEYRTHSGIVRLKDCNIIVIKMDPVQWPNG